MTATKAAGIVAQTESISRFIVSAFAFLAALLLLSAACAALWGGCVSNVVYNCTDDAGWFDFFTPGNWVHGKVAYVSAVKTGRSMSEPDQVLGIFGILGLWAIWTFLFAASVGVSLAISRKVWRATK